MSTTAPQTLQTAQRPAVGSDLPVVVIGAGPVGLAAAAHLADRGLRALVLEAADHVGAAMREWGHIRTFTPWQYIVDPTAEKLLAPTGWARPAGRQSPTGAEIVEQYLVPLADALGDAVRTDARVVAVSRQGLDRSRSVGRPDRPFVVRVAHPDGSVEDVTARAVLDASGTWHQHNPLGASGLKALGEDQARAAGFLVGPLPDVLGADRGRFAGRSTLVVGMGHSAANTLVALAQLAREVPGTRIVWAIRGTSARRVFGGGTADQLADRGRLGADLQELVETGALEYITGFSTRQLRVDEETSTVTVIGDTAKGERTIEGLHNVAAATGFRPDLGIVSELQLDLDPGLQSPRVLGPLITPEAHSCGTVAPHGWRELAHENEPGFFVVGMKSYGRAPTFLITTGNEQVRSIAAHLAGDDAAADEVQLVLPETGVCSASNALSDEQVAAGVQALGGCCDAEELVETVTADPQAALARVSSDPELVASFKRLGFATGVPNGRAGDTAAEAEEAKRPALPLADLAAGVLPQLLPVTDPASTLAPARAVPRAGAGRRRPRTLFYGWRIVAVLAVTETLSWGVLYYAFSVFQVPIGAELGLTSAQLSGAFSLAVLLTGVAAVPVGRWLDGRGPRGLMTAGSAVCALLVVAWSQVHSAVGLYLVMAGIGLTRAAVLYDPAFAVIVRWFHSRRSSALLAVTVVAGFASTVALPTSNALIDALGWRRALLVLAAALAAATVLPHWLVLRRDPADVGAHPDGANHPPPAAPDHHAGVAGGWSATARWAGREPVFRWYAAAFAAQAAMVIVVAVHLVPFLREHGHSATFAAVATGALGALSVSGRLVLTGVVRRVPVAVVAAAMFAAQGAGVLVLLAAGSATWAAVVFVLLFGLGFGVGTIARPALLADAFGTARYGTLAGLLTVVTTAATTLAPVIAGAARTATGTYTPALIGLVAMSVVAAASLVRAARLTARGSTEPARRQVRREAARGRQAGSKARP